MNIIYYDLVFSIRTQRHSALPANSNNQKCISLFLLHNSIPYEILKNSWFLIMSFWCTRERERERPPALINRHSPPPLPPLLSLMFLPWQTGERRTKVLSQYQNFSLITEYSYFPHYLSDRPTSTPDITEASTNLYLRERSEIKPSWSQCVGLCI